MKLLKTIAMASLVLLSGAVLAAPKAVFVVPLSGAIGPAAADFVSRGIARAEKENAQLIVLQIDTPGGLDTAMRQIIKAILASSVPVATFVAPSGARAASAGTYILYASHVAAMAPGTNLGAATPVQIGITDPIKSEPFKPEPAKKSAKDKDANGDQKNDEKRDEKQDKKQEKKQDEKRDTDNVPAPTGDTQSAMTKKQVHDAAAYIRGLAQMRGRNAEWAERAVREAVSLSADEALAQKVIDLTARDVPELLAKLNGRKLTTAAGERTLETTGATVVTIEPDWKNKLLIVITDPSIALILMMIGIYGLFFEFYNPGFVLPGVAGAICLLLGLFALQMLPINYAGLGLILLGIAFMVAEGFVGTFGVLGIGGIIAFAVGALMLIDTELPGFGIPLSLIAGLAMVTAAFVFFVSTLAVQARRRPLASRADMAGGLGVMLEDADTQGWARVHGERWQVCSAQPLRRDQRVRVTARDGLVLTVVPVNEKGE